MLESMSVAMHTAAGCGAAREVTNKLLYEQQPARTCRLVASASVTATTSFLLGCAMGELAALGRRAGVWRTAALLASGPAAPAWAHLRRGWVCAGLARLGQQRQVREKWRQKRSAPSAPHTVMREVLTVLKRMRESMIKGAVSVFEHVRRARPPTRKGTAPVCVAM